MLLQQANASFFLVWNVVHNLNLWMISVLFCDILRISFKIHLRKKNVTEFQNSFMVLERLLWWTEETAVRNSCSANKGYLFRSPNGFMMLWLSGTIIHSIVFKLHILSMLSVRLWGCEDMLMLKATGSKLLSLAANSTWQEVYFACGGLYYINK